MGNDKEQIEEMARDIAKKSCYLYDNCPKEPKHNCISQDPEVMLESSKNYVTIATWLVKEGYRKVEEVRKETAKEIYKELRKQFCGPDGQYRQIIYDCGEGERLEDIDDLIDWGRYGVEVEE